MKRKLPVTNHQEALRGPSAMMGSGLEPRTRGQARIMARPGQTALLPCRCPEAVSILMMKVVKEDAGNCFFYREGQPRDLYQLPSCKDRVGLKDPRMENGEVSVFLRNVSLSDTGTYKCVVGYEVAGRQ
ncbi:immunoglobulin superfamily member 11-like [Sphaeramia orbicularis]|uniref:immunoglobulin superfamily member 11-like n=1 Tax=Sphaeramia orbicularis TaxID=375764 RepID=UPI00117C3B4E|nr:immunoglobulin superfamily member 11-like [Sphaeramia orbicularis]